MIEHICIFQASPMYWVSKWVDYSDKYGFGYAFIPMPGMPCPRPGPNDDLNLTTGPEAQKPLSLKGKRDFFTALLHCHADS